MAKDPATLWYWNDWQGGTITFTRHLKGCYMDLLHAQFNSGRLSLDEIKTVLGADFSAWNTLQKKFEKDENGLYYNKRAEEEKEKRKAFTESRRNNLLSPHKATHKVIHTASRMENENEDINAVKDFKEIEQKPFTSSELNDARFKYDERIESDIKIWNDFAKKHGLAQVLTRPQYRKNYFYLRYKEPDFDMIKILSGLEKKEWGLKGDWKIDLDKIISDGEYYVKLIEANTIEDKSVMKQIQQQSKENPFIAVWCECKEPFDTPILKSLCIEKPNASLVCKKCSKRYLLSDILHREENGTAVFF